MATVRIFAHSGLANYTADSHSVLSLPYLQRETVDAGPEPISTKPPLTAAGSTKLLHVQIEDGKTVAIELNSGSRSIPADKDSPRYRGDVVLPATVGCTLSILEVP